jgi:hypothetical protein
MLWVYRGKPRSPSDAHPFTAVNGSTVRTRPLQSIPSDRHPGIQRLKAADGASPLTNELMGLPR